jgi:23S rRNA (pseudouridine1915-N3)-methyltransferase
MRITVIAVGQRIPNWAQSGWDEFYKRFPDDFSIELKTIKAEPRGSKTTSQLMSAEAARILEAIPKGAFVIALDEWGKNLRTEQLSTTLQGLQVDYRDVVFLIGGPDGLSPSLKDLANLKLRLSDLTLPHAMVRVVLIEQLYRAWSIMVHHPYHRE